MRRVGMMTMRRIKANDRNKAQLIFNSFLCCFSLRTGSLTLACANVAMSVTGIWHSLHYGNMGCRHPECPGIKTVHYVWTGVSSFSFVFNAYLLISLIKKSFKSITIWTVWNGIVLIIRFTIFVLILALNGNKQSVAGNISFHIIAFFVTIYSILVLLSYNQQVTLMTFGYFERYRYPAKRFPLKVKHDDYSEADDEEMRVFIEEEFV
ncbi:uncharacterized protein LOC114525271 [Dendronephthya gigantea]|uniref:uncharacterized protein LOC114525271 n=1 Tax=Dendronephthya gigantea TaxID=151771 RepID=UPI00106C9E52|nr:uncharacterized protein LOC114525271 [Dendronephthya gigantea]